MLRTARAVVSAPIWGSISGGVAVALRKPAGVALAGVEGPAAQRRDNGPATPRAPPHARGICAHCVSTMMGEDDGAGGAGGHAHSTDYAFEMAASNIRFGAGATDELGFDVAAWGARRVLLCTDPGLAATPAVRAAVASLERAGVAFDVYDTVRVEPTDSSLLDAIGAAKRGGPYDAFVAVGGGSVMDTAKAANLYSSYPDADFLDFVNAPIGKGLPVPGPVKPLLAVPTTSGTGSETTGVSIFDYKPLGAKTGIASRLIRPTLGIVDPNNMITTPRAVAVAAGFDVLSHAIESYTAIPFDQRSPRPATPEVRPAYQGSNPISDVWCITAMKLLSQYFVRSIEDPEDTEAREKMALAATYAGVGFGNAGVHLPHGMSYAVSGLNKDYRHPGYDVDHPLVPHGVSVILNAPAVFRFTGQACPERHLEAAAALGVDVSNAPLDGAGEIVADHLSALMDRLGVPNGIHAIGYGESDVSALAEVTVPQHRVTKLSPRPVGFDELKELFKDALHY